MQDRWPPLRQTLDALGLRVRLWFKEVRRCDTLCPGFMASQPQPWQPRCSHYLLSFLQPPTPTAGPAPSAAQHVHSTLGFCRSCFLCCTSSLCRFRFLVLTQVSAQIPSPPPFLKQQPLPVTPTLFQFFNRRWPPKVSTSLLLIISSPQLALEAHEGGALFLCSLPP